MLPQILDHLGFTGSIHATLDDGRFPTSGASRQRWEGLDGTTIESLMRVPIDAARATGFVRLPHALSGATDMDNQPTAIFAHWPGATSCWYEDIQRVRRYTGVLGTFRTLGDYFEQTGMSGHQTAFHADEYRSPYLCKAVAGGEKDPISRRQFQYVWAEAGERAKASSAMAVFAGGMTKSVPADFARAVGAGNMTSETPAGIIVINDFSFSRRIRIDVAPCPHCLMFPARFFAQVMHTDGKRRSSKSLRWALPCCGQERGK